MIQRVLQYLHALFEIDLARPCRFICRLQFPDLDTDGSTCDCGSHINTAIDRDAALGLDRSAGDTVASSDNCEPVAHTDRFTAPDRTHCDTLRADHDHALYD